MKRDEFLKGIGLAGLASVVMTSTPGWCAVCRKVNGKRANSLSSLILSSWE